MTSVVDINVPVFVRVSAPQSFEILHNLLIKYAIMKNNTQDLRVADSDISHSISLSLMKNDFFNIHFTTSNKRYLLSKTISLY